MFFKRFDWALSSELIRDLNLHYEVWSKAGKGPGFGVDNQEEYILFLIGYLIGLMFIFMASLQIISW